MSLGNRILDAFKAVWQRQQLTMANLTGNAFLLFVLYSWFSSHDLATAEWRNAAMTLGLVGVFGIWLQAATLAAFHSDKKETPFFPVVRRFPQYLPWAVMVVGFLVLIGWLASKSTMLIWLVGVGALLALLPILSQAAGGGFCRDAAFRVVTSEQYWLAGSILLVAGLCLPFLLLGWVPTGTNFIFRALISGIRFGFSYVLAMMSWLALLALVARMGIEVERGQAPPLDPDKADAPIIEYPEPEPIQTVTQPRD